MSNTLKTDLTGKVVIFKQSRMSVVATEHPFRVEGGFGAFPTTIGSALIGTFLSDGEEATMDGYAVERFATDEEIQAAETGRPK